MSSLLAKMLSMIKGFMIMPKTDTRIEVCDRNEFDLTTALTLYKEFIDKKYYASSDHSLPSEFIARCVKSNAIWLVNLLMGIAFYTIKFEPATESYFTPELLKKAGYTDPCVTHGLVKRAWTQRTSAGKNPLDPQYESELSGLGIANYDASGLLDFYTGKTLKATLPKMENNKPVYDSKGNLITETKEVLFKDSTIKGWGMTYGNKVLSLDGICWNPNIAYTETENGECCLCCKKPNDLSFKCVGASVASKNLKSTDRENWYAWSRYYLTGDGSKITNNVLFPAAKWFCSYWSPYYAWGKNNQMQDIDQVMMLSAIANSTPSLAKKSFGKSVDEMISAYATNSHRKRRAYNTLRAIAIVKYLQDIDY